MIDASDAQRAHYLFCVSFVQFIMDWNATEDVAFDILTAFSGQGLANTLVVRQLHNVGLKDTLRLIAQDHRSSGLRDDIRIAEHLDHFVEGFDRLRVYRNFYVHSLAAVKPMLDTCVGELRGLEVKASYNSIEQELTFAELGAFTRHTMRLRSYGLALLDEIRSHPGERPPSLLQKPTWPDKLSKRRRNLIAPTPPPQS